MKQIEISVGSHISGACADAVLEATNGNEPVEFEFNGTKVIANPNEESQAVQDRWQKDSDAAREAYLASTEYKEAEERREREKRKRESATLTESATTEADMRDAKSPWPYNERQLIEYIKSVTERSHDYGTCVYAMSLAAVAAFNFVSHQLGVTGFQASCADLDFIRRTRHLDGPFMLIKGADALYPQYDLLAKLSESMAEWKPWLKEQAAKKLAESPDAHPEVLAHWKKLAEVA